MLDMTRSRRVATRAVEQGAYTHGARRGGDDVQIHSSLILRYPDNGIANSPLIPF